MNHKEPFYLREGDWDQDAGRGGGFLTEQLPLEPTLIDLEATFAQASQYEEDFSEVRGPESVKRTLVVAAASGHNILLIGPSVSSRHNPLLSRELLRYC